MSDNSWKQHTSREAAKGWDSRQKKGPKRKTKSESNSDSQKKRTPRIHKADRRPVHLED